MKSKVILSIICLSIFYNVANSQEFFTEQGSRLISGTVSMSSWGGDLFEDYDGNRSNQITIASGYNYFIMNNLFVGGTLAYNGSMQGDSKDNEIAVGPQIGYMYGDANSTVYPFIVTGIHYQYSAIKYSSNDYKTSGTDVIWGIGLVLPIKTHVGFTIEADYHMMNIKQKESDQSYSGNTFLISIGIAGLLF